MILTIKPTSRELVTLLRNAGGGIWTHGPLRDEVSPPHGSERRANGLTPLAMLGNSRVSFSFEQPEIYILSILFLIPKIISVWNDWWLTLTALDLVLPNSRRIKLRIFLDPADIYKSKITIELATSYIWLDR